MPTAEQTRDEANDAVQRKLRLTQGHLGTIHSALQQIASRRARAAVGSAASTVGGAAAAGTLVGAVGWGGIASTGAAIASLSGAAKTTATLYWIGGLAGGGVAAGGLVVAATAIGGGVVASRAVRGKVFGDSLAKDVLPGEQRDLLDAIALLVTAISDAAATDPDRRELELFFRLGLDPVISTTDNLLQTGALVDLKLLHRVRVRNALQQLKTLSESIKT